MKRKLFGGTLMAVVILGSLALATARDQQPAVEDNTLTDGGHSKIWVKIDGAPAQKIPETKEPQPAVEPEAEVTPETETAPVQEAQQDTPGTEELQKKLASAETTIQALQEKLTAAQQAVENVEELQQKLADAESAVQKLEKQAEESAQTIEELNNQLNTIQALTEQPLTVTECDALRAQVTGLEILAQEQMKTLEKNAEEKNYWQMNKDLLLSNIKELQKNIEQLEEKNRGLQRDLAAARK